MKISLSGKGWLLLLWFILCLLQANGSELLDDEAYYWMYAQNLDWGYFDHPPMVALLVKIGGHLFSGELGVRFAFVIMALLTILGLERLVKPKNDLLFISIIGSVGVIHFFGFMALPDSALLAFSVWFFVVLKEWLNHQKWWHPILLGVLIAGMLLSKYHGFLVLAFTIFANPSIIKKKDFLSVSLLTILLCLPHFIWQINHGFPSISYHLFERSAAAYSYTNTLKYVVTFPFVLGPFIGMLAIWAYAKSKADDTFSRILRYNYVGVLFFFFLMSFKGEVEAHWTLITLVPAVCLVYKFLENNQGWHKWHYSLSVIGLVLILGGRLFLVFDLFTPLSMKDLSSEFHNKKNWAQAIEKKAGSEPVVFMNSYQNCAVYNFYSDGVGVCMNTVFGRKNQFDIWESLEQAKSRDVIMIPNFHVDNIEEIRNNRMVTQYDTIPNFQYYDNIRILASDLKKEYERGEKVELAVELIPRHGDSIVSLDLNHELPVRLSYQWIRHGKVHDHHWQEPPLRGIIEGMRSEKLYIQIPKEAGKYELFISLKTGRLLSSRNSEAFKVSVR